MSWLAQNWQTVAVGAIILLTLAILVRRMLTRKRRGCGGSCDCGGK